MTYFSFLAVFLLPPIFIFVILAWHRKLSQKAWLAIGLHVVVAVLYTTPWDNYLVATRVWWYDPALVTGLTFGYVPIEEYTFFVLQTLMSGLLIALLLPALVKPVKVFKRSWNMYGNLLVTSVLGLICLVTLVALVLGWQSGTYLGLILVWALPPIILQTAFGMDILIRYRKPVLTGIFAPFVYLSIADTLAISTGTWTINPSKTLGWHFWGGLPLEEGLFFLMTNILIVFGITLLLAPEGQERIELIKGVIKKSKNRHFTDFFFGVIAISAPVDAASKKARTAARITPTAAHKASHKKA